MTKKKTMFDFQPLVDLETEFRTKVEEKGSALLKAETAKLFTKHPDLDAISFLIYRPNFNDGDACLVGIQGMYAKLKTPTDTPNPSSEDVENEDEDSSEWLDSYDVESKELQKSMGLLERNLENILSSLEIIFGEDVRVVITKDGVEKEDYLNHD